MLSDFPGTVAAGATHSLTVTARDIYQNTATGYTGTVTFTSNDPQVAPGDGLPANYTFTVGDGGQHTFTGVFLKSAGTRSIAVVDSVSGSITGNQSGITVNAGAPATIVATTGDNQSTVVNTSFANELGAKVADLYGNPVPGVSVTFAGPGSGAGVTFPSGATAITGATGEASVAVQANTVAGTYSATASTAGVGTPASFSLTNNHGAAANIAVSSGNNQSTTVNTSFAASLTALVADSFGNPVPGATINFTGPGSGAGVTFPFGATATTDANGKGSVAVNANTVAGTYSATASTAGVGGTATFGLTNNPGAAASLAAVSGGNQSATVGTTFANPLTVRVTDAFGNNVPGQTIAFAAPGSGASATFPSGATAITGSDGRASVPVRANAIAGSYNATASTAGLGPISFPLTNTAGSPTIVTVIGGSGQTTTMNAAFAAPLAVRVTDALGNPVAGAIVAFAAPSSGAAAIFTPSSTATTSAGGTASVGAVANGRGGSYAVTASVAGGTTAGAFALTNRPLPLAGPLATSGSPDGAVRLFVPGPGGQYGAAATMHPFGPLTTDVRATEADVDGDGIADTIAVTGPGTPIRVAVVSGRDHATLLVQPFDPFGGNFLGGGFVSAADFDGDGRAEFVVTPDRGGGPRVSIYSLVGSATALRANFLTVDPDFRGGARSGAGDINADGVPDLAVSAGYQGGPRIVLLNGKKVFTTDGTSLSDKLINDFFAFSPLLRNGAYVAVGDVNGDGFGDMIFGAGPGGGPEIRIVSGKQLLTAGSDAALLTPIADYFLAGDLNNRGGVRVGVKDADGDNKADVVAGVGENQASSLRLYLGSSFVGVSEPPGAQPIDPFGQFLTDGVFVG